MPSPPETLARLEGTLGLLSVAAVGKGLKGGDQATETEQLDVSVDVKVLFCFIGRIDRTPGQSMNIEGER